MRPLEITLLLLDLAVVLLPLLARPGGAAWRWLAALAPLSVFVLMAQLVLERYRWQMVPLYALTVLLLAVRLPGLLGRQRTQSRRRGAWAGAIAGVVLLGLAAAAPVLFPVPNLPAPGGPFAIGTVTFQWKDPARPE